MQRRDDGTTAAGHAAATVREAVDALSRRMAGDFGDLVPAASAGRTADLVATLERGGALGAGAPELETLDSWIRAADSLVLHDDAAEAEARRAAGERLRAVREMVAPGGRTLTEDHRDD